MAPLDMRGRRHVVVGSVVQMSRADEITSEVRRLVMTCKQLEAQLQQSIPKKQHEEEMAKMQAQVDDLSAKLAATSEELQRTVSLGERLNALESQVSAQMGSITFLGEAIKALSEKLSESTVPQQLYSQAMARIQDLEAQLSSMVTKAQYDDLRMELANSVPRSKYEELERAMQQMVPREEHEAAMARIAELESSLANSVPRSTFEELRERIASIMKEVPSAVEGQASPPREGPQ